VDRGAASYLNSKPASRRSDFWSERGLRVFKIEIDGFELGAQLASKSRFPALSRPQEQRNRIFLDRLSDASANFRPEEIFHYLENYPIGW
jgi:hypothetical protein